LGLHNFHTFHKVKIISVNNVNKVKLQQNILKMKKEYRYKLDRSSKKVICPSCKKKTFVLYIDTLTGEILPENYGRCDRESKCNHKELPPLETKCLFVPFDSIKEHKASFQIIAKGRFYYLPQSQVFEINTSGAYVSEFILKSEMTENPPPFIESDIKYFNSLNNSYKVTPQQQAPKLSFIPDSILKATLKGYESNVFINNLMKYENTPFNASDISKAISLYYLGTITKGVNKGAICFPFIDINGKVRTIQAKQFDSENHTTKTTFIHAIMQQHYKNENLPFPLWLNDYLNNEKFVSCLFGEHLLKKYPTNPVALVEAPKSAIYSTLFFGFPDNPKNYIWLSTYNLSSLTLEKCEVLQGRNVVLFPDLSKDGKAFDLWHTKANEFKKAIPNTNFNVSDLLEKNATAEQKNKGLDIADYLIKIKRQTEPKETAKKQPPAEQLETISFENYVSGLTIENGILIYSKYPAIWDTTPHNKAIEQKTKDFILMANKNHNLLKLGSEMKLNIQ